MKFKFQCCHSCLRLRMDCKKHWFRDESNELDFIFVCGECKDNVIAEGSDRTEDLLASGDD